MTQSLYVETRIVGFTLYSLGEFRYMRNIEDFSAVVQRQISGRESSRESHLVHTQARTRRAGGTKWRNSMRSSEVASLSTALACLGTEPTWESRTAGSQKSGSLSRTRQSA